MYQNWLCRCTIFHYPFISQWESRLILPPSHCEYCSQHRWANLYRRIQHALGICPGVIKLGRLMDLFLALWRTSISVFTSINSKGFLFVLFSYYYIYFYCVCVVCKHACTQMNVHVCKLILGRPVLGPFKMELQMTVNHLTWVLWILSRPSGRAGGALNTPVISPTLSFLFLILVLTMADMQGTSLWTYKLTSAFHL